MVEATRFINGQFDHLFSARCETNLAEHYTISATNDKLNSVSNSVQFDAQVTQYFCRNAFTLAYKTQQEMFCANIIVLEALRLLLSQTQNSSGSLRELVKSVSITHPVFVLLVHSQRCMRATLSLKYTLYEYIRKLSYNVASLTVRSTSTKIDALYQRTDNIRRLLCNSITQTALHSAYRKHPTALQ